MSGPTAPQTRSGFRIAIICALKVEAESVYAMFDKCWEEEGKSYGRALGDNNTYTTGVISRYNVVLMLLPSMGSVPAAQGAASLSSSFPNIELVLVVGVCGVVPKNPETGEEIILGDVILSTAVEQYDFGRTYPGGFIRKTSIQESLRKPPKIVRSFIDKLGMQQNRRRLQTNLSQLVDLLQNELTAVYPGATHDHLYDASYLHQHRSSTMCDQCYNHLNATCSLCCDSLGCEKEKLIPRQRLRRRQSSEPGAHPDGNPFIHLGRIGSANTIMRSGIERDKLATVEGLIAFEMEGAGVWDEHPTIVIKGACDHADSHKQKAWQPYAAMMAAACLKVVLDEWVASGDLLNGDTLRSLGICLTSAPLIQPDEFIGRNTEIGAIHDILRPDEAAPVQRRVVLGGIGGIGKTQLAIAYALKHGHHFSSVLWLNAASEQTLHASLRLIAEQLVTATELEQLDTKQMLTLVRGWLLHPPNTQWLIIFDNYDNPDQLDLGKYYPHRSCGSMIITTRLPDKVTGSQVRVQPFKVIDDSLNILQIRSGRKGVRNDFSARLLAERMAGLPLALATAGAFLRKSTLSFQQYLEAYEERWQVDRRRPLRLQEYPNRTLYTTWDLTYNRLNNEDSEAAHMLKVLAYFDHQEIWYDLLRAGLSKQRPPPWLPASLADRFDFESVMGTLVDYCLVEVQHVSHSFPTYGMHSCVHEWTLRALNDPTDPQLYWYAFDCVAASIDHGHWDALRLVQYARLSYHASQLTHHHFKLCDQLNAGLSERLNEALWIARMLNDQSQFSAAEQMSERIVAWCESVLGSTHASTLTAISNLTALYIFRGKLAEAEQMCIRVLSEYEAALAEGKELQQRLILVTINNFGLLYRRQGKLDKAEQMVLQALAGKEKSLGPEHLSTLVSVADLGLIYQGQGRLAEAEQMLMRALAGREAALAREEFPEHISILDTVHILGVVYADQGRLAEAEKMLVRALVGRQQALEPEHPLTLCNINHLGFLYLGQGRLEDAEQAYRRVLSASPHDRTDSQRRSAADYLTVTLSRAVRMQGHDLTARQTSLIRLMEHVARWASNTEYLAHVLANVLIHLKEDEDASLVYVNCLVYSLGKAEFKGVICDGCDSEVVIAKGRWVCRQCHDIDLCDDCMAKYTRDDISVAACHGHDYCDVGAAVKQLLQTSTPTPSRDPTAEMKTWLARLCEKYRA